VSTTRALPDAGRAYLVGALEHAPAALAALLAGLAPGAAAWDFRPEPDRFTLREVVAHLADWEELWRERFTRPLTEDTPTLPRPDPGQRGEERGYAAADPAECLARFRAERAALAAYLSALPEDAWTRPARLERIGDITLEGIVALLFAHDAYHLRQAAEWLAAARPLTT
jgi:uncharacterized damage-inducible protein DinB